MVTWAACRGLFAFDGGWLDVYVFGTDECDWQRFLDLVRAETAVPRLTVDGVEAPLPEHVQELFARREHAAVCLGIDTPGLWTPENPPDRPLLRFDPAIQEFTHGPTVGSISRPPRSDATSATGA
jgi:hypothetical protein